MAYLFLRAMVLSQVKEVKDVSVPRFEVDGKGPWSFVAALVDVASCVVVYPQHWYKTIGCTVGLNHHM